jgi:hypothetical protein
VQKLQPILSFEYLLSSSNFFSRLWQRASAYVASASRFGEAISRGYVQVAGDARTKTNAKEEKKIEAQTELPLLPGDGSYAHADLPRPDNI